MFNWMMKIIHKEVLQDDVVLDNMYLDAFRIESQYLKDKRKQAIEKDALYHNKMLINNPNRDVTFRHPTVL